MHQTDQDPGYPSQGRARFTQAVAALIGLFSMMDIQIVGLLIEPMKTELRLTDTQIGLAQATAFYAAYGLLAIPMGMLADRLVRVRLLLAAMSLWCAGLVMIGLSHGVWMLATAKALMGVANAATLPAALSLLADSFAPDRRAFATASYAMGQGLGQAGAILVGGIGYSALVARVATDPHALGDISPWRVVSLVFAGFGVLLVLLILTLREPARIEKRQQAGSLRELLAYRRFLGPLAVGVTFMQAASGSFGTWFAPILMRIYKLQPGDFAMPAGLIMLVSGLAGLATSGQLVNIARARGGNRAITIPAAIAAALCIPGCFMALMPSLWLFAVLGALFIFCAATAVSVPIILLNLRMPNELRGLCMGIYVLLVSASGMIGAPLVGFINETLGGETRLGLALALVCTPAVVISVFGFLAAGGRPSGEGAPPAVSFAGV